MENYEFLSLNMFGMMPLVGLGTYKIEGEQVFPVLDSALAAGYRLFDTAKVYNNEREIGQAFETLLPKHGLTRKDIVITTKMHPNTEESVRRLVDESLEFLKTNYIDVYLVHYPKSFDYADEDPINAKLRIETYRTLLMIQKECKIRQVGVSNYEIRHLQEVKGDSLPFPFCNQIEYHPHFIRKDLKNFCERNGIFVQAFSSFAKHNQALYEAPIITTLARKYAVPKTVILLSFATSQMVGVIPKSTNPERMAQNLQIIKLEKSEIEEVAKLDLNQNYVRTTGWLVL